MTCILADIRHRRIGEKVSLCTRAVRPLCFGIFTPANEIFCEPRTTHSYFVWVRGTCHSARSYFFFCREIVYVFP